ncbi:mannitol dehydrogenase family protein [Agrobacterium salinitolerans]|uniref:mannitol dehydrogenase family protein n=1 Tax=Agrobacterium salinitolerans TaxID=1183413 RepID=UPI001C24BACB|nr:mannitol dehydrogenase family protein [Agrobacterium salinitolerans]QXC47728.1 mannitol dehydrogenase family protein [Agrobacterium salinitolerans]
MTDRLSAATLPRLAQSVTTPAYDRQSVTPGIVHLGVGAFHRAHQAVFIDDCLNRGETRWGIVAASLRSPDTRDAIEPQDNLYTFCLRDGESERLRVIGSILETIVAPEEPERLLERMADPRVLIVTLTVTEKGYLTNLASRSLLRDHPDIVHDLENPERPRSIFGFILAATRRRRKEGSRPLTLLSCDNLPANGHVLQKLLLEFAELTDPELASFIRANIACPCSMVDRIVPATTDADREAISTALGLSDAWPVVAEPYFRFVIEDRFPHGRPALEKSGVEFVGNVEPYEHMKLRMLNGSHSAIAAIGQIAGLATVADAWNEKPVRDFVDAYWREIERTLDPAVDGAEFADGLRERFANPSLQHKTMQIASDASQKVPLRILGPLRDLLAEKAKSRAVIFAVALWIRSCADKNEKGQPITILDPAFKEWDAPDQLAMTSAAVVDRFLTFERTFGSDLPRNETFVPALKAAYRDIREHGALAAIERFLKS